MLSSAVVTGESRIAPLVGLSAAIGAAISMGVSEALSDDGTLTGRSGPWRRGTVTGIGTLIGAVGHSLPFLIPHVETAFVFAVVLVVELIAIA